VTYIHILILWEYFVEIMHKFDELGGSLSLAMSGECKERA
jgi:hypothetical protein